MTTNPLTILTEESSKISPDISSAKTAYMFSQLLEYVGYDELESIPSTEIVSIEEQNDAIKTLASIIASLNSGKTVEESILIEFEPDDIQLEHREFIPESAVMFIDDLNVNKTTEDQQNNSTQINYDSIIVLEDEQEENKTKIYEEDIMLYVIPLIMARLMSEESLIEDSKDGEIRVYQSDEFTASLLVTATEEQILILKRKQYLYSETEVALNAVRKTNYAQFQVTTNQLTEAEIEKFKLIALMEYNQSNQLLKKEQELGE
ncbi:hypothetical protein H6G54_28855 [Anabaena cylindrica FACHB-243]|uniref:Uncharacterized protein n=1 Tax=Anabaena cylindrica (strain ATCC 27899 / PCC 7122) TaxID=272123 RepID=K9ZRZ4_ANACC|nr:MULTISPECIES: hypothetical protein [Anabaena]AFZ61140.1 hypothetical protein Anacy_5847 [Anabaena cylindrica PCC 7122]MBD2421616.1 hypothetical protein [Anabaena cylindrica FACHB-243]MBY5280485.1 hypothetical protein [Anabaena sp. CCAP 1446/1C]MBY5308216.1 hypothetical protein [Anabaena sp. CCAP 1446/1C]MCM2405483.1 hypothetical protein [Anabaena sp. CCAP 1446/1C]